MDYNDLDKYFVYIDTNIFEGTGFNPNTTGFRALKSHIKHGNIQILSNDVLEHEIKSHIGSLVSEQRNAVKRNERLHILEELGLVKVSEEFKELSHKDITESYFKKVIEGLEPKYLKIGDIPGDFLFSRFKDKLPPFGPGKSDEYNDLLQIMCLKKFKETPIKHIDDYSWDLPNREPIKVPVRPELIIISNDKKFIESSKDLEVGDHHFSSLPQFLEFYIKDYSSRDLEKEKRYIKNLITKHNHWLMDPDSVEVDIETDDYKAEAYFVRANPDKFYIREIDLVDEDDEEKYATYNIVVDGSLFAEVHAPENRAWDGENKEYVYWGSDIFYRNLDFTCEYAITIYYDEQNKHVKNHEVELDEIGVEECEIHWDN